MTYATGNKSGGFSGAITSPGQPIEFDPEESDSIEAGIKSVMLDGRLRLNFDVYRLNLKDFQGSTTNPVTQSGFIVGNAGDRRAGLRNGRPVGAV